MYNTYYTHLCTTHAPTHQTRTNTHAPPSLFKHTHRNHTVRLPPDLLWLEWFQGKHEAAQHIGSRFLAVYKYNVFDHIGTISSFTVRPNRPKWPACFDPMANAYVWVCALWVFGVGGCGWGVDGCGVSV